MTIAKEATNNVQNLIQRTYKPRFVRMKYRFAKFFIFTSVDSPNIHTSFLYEEVMDSHSIISKWQNLTKPASFMMTIPAFTILWNVLISLCKGILLGDFSIQYGNLSAYKLYYQKQWHHKLSIILFLFIISSL